MDLQGADIFVHPAALEAGHLLAPEVCAHMVLDVVFAPHHLVALYALKSGQVVRAKNSDNQRFNLSLQGSTGVGPTYGR